MIHAMIHHSSKRFVFLYCAFISTNVAAQSTDTAVEPSYVPDPPGRGTVGLLLSSVLTLILCLWTAVHVNILKKPTTGRILVLKSLWVLVGLLAPELVLWYAYDEYRQARAIMVAVTEARVIQASETHPTTTTTPTAIFRRFINWWNLPPDQEFDMECALFVLMGGFTIIPRDFPNEQITVSSVGLINLLRHRIIVPPSLDQFKRDIGDKAKADMLSKFLVCTQGLWLIIQCIARHAQGLPVTLLEIHIMMHVVCAAIMYGFWWNKPFDAGRSISLEVDDEIAALLCYNSGQRQGVTLRVSRTVPGALWPSLAVSSRAGHPEMAELPGFVRYGPYPAWKSLRWMSRKLKRGSKVIAFEGQTMVNRDKGFAVEYHKPISCVSDPVASMEFYSCIADIIRSAQENRTLVGRAIMVVDNTDYPLVPTSSLSPVELSTEMSTPLPGGRVASRNILSKYSYVFVELLSLIYGGGHAAAWNSHFPTDQERLLWRLSCITVMLPALVMLSIHLFKFLLITPRPRSEGNNCLATGNFFLRMIRNILLALLFVLAGSYVCANVFLVVEAFISVRSLPAGSFKTPEWENLWPHL